MGKNYNLDKIKSFYDDHKASTLHILFGILSISALVIPMVLFKYFYVDWTNHSWLLEYYTEYFRRNGDFPVIINATHRVGCTYPLYYGQIFYEVLALVTLVTGNARLTFIITVAALYVAVYAVCTRLFNIYADNYLGGRNRYFGIIHVIIIIILFSPYSITNLYNRNALTEFYAVYFLYLAIGTWLIAILEADIWRSLLFWTICALSIVMMVGTHPITAQVGGIVFILMALLSIKPLIKKIKSARRIIVIGIAEAMLIFLSCSAWLYIVLIGGVETLQIGAASNLSIIGNDFSENAYLTRLIPFPFDFRTLTRAAGDVSTPYLDMQINMPLAILYMVSFPVLLVNKSVEKKKKIISLLFGGCSLIWFAFSSSVKAKVITDVLFSHVQFAYRLITYVDLFVAVGLLYNLAVVYSNS